MGMTRREFIKGAGAMAVLGAIGLPRLSFANLPTDHRFILVILRGALDGLAAVTNNSAADSPSRRPANSMAHSTLTGSLASTRHCNHYFRFISNSRWQ